MNFRFRILFLIVFLLALFTRTFSQSYKIFNGDTINRIDNLGRKQGFWIRFGADENSKSNRIIGMKVNGKIINTGPLKRYKNSDKVNEGIYVDDKMTGVWSFYDEEGNLFSKASYSNNVRHGELTRYYASGGVQVREHYINGVQDGLFEYYNKSGAKVEAGEKYEGAWKNTYTIYDEKGNGTIINPYGDDTLQGRFLTITGFSEINWMLFAEQDRSYMSTKRTIKVRNSKNEVVSTFTCDSIGNFLYRMPQNVEYVFTFLRPGFISQSIIVSTKSESAFKRKQYVVSVFTPSLKKTEEITKRELLNIPLERYAYDPTIDKFTKDQTYNKKIKEELSKFDKNSTKIMSRYLVDKSLAEIEQLKDEAGEKNKEIEQMEKKKLLMDAEIKNKQVALLNKELESEKRAREIDQISKEKAIQQFKLKEQEEILLRQKLETANKSREIDVLSKAQLTQELKLIGQDLEIKQQKIDAKQKQLELEKEKKDKEMKAEEVKYQKQIKNYILIGLFLMFILLFFIFRSLQQNKKAKKVILAQKEMVDQKNHIIEEKQKEIIDSINYAKRIQYTLLAHEDFLKTNIPEHFIYFNPKDIVSGDFYWATKKENKFYLAVCDSTGHGVPGAFMSLLNIGFLSEAINEKGIEKPNEVFEFVRQRLIKNISKEGQKDGFDGILLCMDSQSGKITYAAANNAPILIKKNSILELEADRMPVGIGERKEDFTLFTVDASKNDVLFLYTDGFADQFGGPRGKKFKYKKLNELIVSNSNMPIETQKQILQRAFEDWKGDLEQVDDVTIVGIKI